MLDLFSFAKAFRVQRSVREIKIIFSSLSLKNTRRRNIKSRIAECGFKMARARIVQEEMKEKETVFLFTLWSKKEKHRNLDYIVF